jgi:hypothetical protein
MRKLLNGQLLLEPLDIIIISYSTGAGLSWLVRTYKQRNEKLEDSLVRDVKKKSPLVKAIGIDGKPLNLGTDGKPLNLLEKDVCKKSKFVEDRLIFELKSKAKIVSVNTHKKPLKNLPYVRGGNIDDTDKVKVIKWFTLVVQNRRLTKLLQVLIQADEKRRNLHAVKMLFATLNYVLTQVVGIHIMSGGSYNITQILFFILPSSLAGFLAETVFKNPVVNVFLPLAILYSRGITKEVSPYDKCEMLCEAVAETQNQELRIQMSEFNQSLPEGQKLPPLPEEGPLECVKEKLSIVERYKLRRVIEMEKAKNRVTFFSDFIKRFPDCDVDPEAVAKEMNIDPELIYQEVMNEINNRQRTKN